MDLLILEDARSHPKLFVWYGPIREPALRAWVTARGLRLPEDFLLLLARTGGGDIFESETILGPKAGYATGDDADGANARYRARGLPDHLWLFHVGVCLSAIDTRVRRYATLDSAFVPTHFFDTLDGWYVSAVRAEFAERYGLRALSEPEL